MKQALLTNVQTENLQPLPSHISPPRILLLALKQLWMKSFIFWTTFTYISLEKLAQQMLTDKICLSRILQGNWNQKHVNQTAACILQLWKAGKFERLDYEVWWEWAVHALALVSERDHHQTLEVRLVTTKCFVTYLGWEVAAHNSMHFPLS